MGVVLLQILQWILRIILFLLLLIVVLLAIILIVPIRYRAEGELLEKKPGVRGKITWFFYLIYMKFAYEEDLHLVVRVLGLKVYDSKQESKEDKRSRDSEDIADETAGKADNSPVRHTDHTESCCSSAVYLSLPKRQHASSAPEPAQIRQKHRIR